MCAAPRFHLLLIRGGGWLTFAPPAFGFSWMGIDVYGPAAAAVSPSSQYLLMNGPGVSRR